MSSEPTPDASQAIRFSPGLSAWLSRHDCSLALTTYENGRLFMIGRRPDGGLRIHRRLIEQCQGLWTDGSSLWTSSMAILWRFENEFLPGHRSEIGADRRFVPREGRVTGRIDCHDIGMGEDGPIFVNTFFNCLATISDKASFRPVWRPPFIARVAPGDRCHLNGLAMDGTRPAYVTAIAATDTVDGWREHRRDGGVIIDVASGEIVASGLSMPHSPRLYDGRLWVLNSGRGEFGTVDPASGRFTAVTACPGYARGLAFIGDHAVIGLSRPRRNKTFTGLELDDALAASGEAPRCGLIVVDLTSGAVVEWLTFGDDVAELYDVAVMAGVRQPEAIGFVGEEIRRAFTLEG